jgi:myo-inositol-1(or 4)-monophosphatase
VTDYMAVAAEAVLRAGAIQKARYGQRIEIRHKGPVDLVTEVDRQCEDAILETLRARAPGHDIVTEETQLARTGSRFCWYVDPLDGTTNYAHGYPCFNASVALAQDGVVVAGAVYEPLRAELFTAERGSGSHLNGRRLRVSETAVMKNALMVTGFPYDIHEKTNDRLRYFNLFIRHARAIRRDGAAALDLSFVAAGRFDAFFEENLQPWDVLAGGLIVEEAGGRISDFDGGPIGLQGAQVLASNGRLQDAMLDLLRAERPASLTTRPAVV